MAKFFGLKPKSITNCKVLELGCAAGGNLVPMAMQLPDSEFIGLDLSAAQVAEGQSVINDLVSKISRFGISIYHGCEHDLGTFDYIIAHGVYSWVVAGRAGEDFTNMQGKILLPQGVALCQLQHLSRLAYARYDARHDALSHAAMARAGQRAA